MEYTLQLERVKSDADNPIQALREFRSILRFKDDSVFFPVQIQVRNDEGELLYTACYRLYQEEILEVQE